jgi:hypothetical protein
VVPAIQVVQGKAMAEWLLSIQLIDFPIRRIIGWMTRAELGGIWSRLRLTKNLVSNNSIIA